MFQCGQRGSVTVGNSLAWEAIGKYVKRICLVAITATLPPLGQKAAVGHS